MVRDRPANDETGLGRRIFLRGAAGALAIGTGLAAGSTTVGAQEHSPCDCKSCWLDVKPDSDPNGINPNNQGVVSVDAGWPRFKEGSVWLAPLSAVTSDEEPSCAELLAFLDDPTGAQPIRSTVEYSDVDDDGDLDTQFKFRTEDIGLDADDTMLVLVGINSDDGCPVWGMDGVKVPRGATDSPHGAAGARSDR